MQSKNRHREKDASSLPRRHLREIEKMYGQIRTCIFEYCTRRGRSKRDANSSWHTTLRQSKSSVLDLCRIYLGDKYTDAAPWEFFDRGRSASLIHPETAAEIEEMLRVLKDEGEDAAFAYVKKRLRESKADTKKTIREDRP